MERTILLASLLALAPAGAAAQTPTAYVVRNVSVIATSGTPATRVHDVVIRGRTITELAPPGGARAPGATIIDGRGKFLIPGLIDSHVHIKQQDPLWLFLASGVTTVQNMSGRPFHIELRDAVNAGRLLGPRIITAGPTTAEVGAGTVAAVQKLVLDQKAAGYNIIKMYGSDGTGAMEPEVYGKLLEAAHAQHMRVVGHAPRNLPFQVVLDEGQNSIDHMEEIVYTHRPFARLLRPYIQLQFGDATPAVRDSLRALPVPDLAEQLQPEIRELARAVKHAGLAVTPNLVFFRNIQWMTTDSINALLREPQLAYAAPAQRLAWSPMLNRYRNAWSAVQDVISPYLGKVVELQSVITRAFHDAGVPLMTGTDSEGLGTQPGYGVHTELELFVAAGIPPLDALRAATIVPARELEIADSVGSIERGKLADLVLLDADPLASISNTRRIAGVFRDGRWLPRDVMQSMQDSLAASYAPVQAALAGFIEALEQEGAVAALEVYRASPQHALIAKPVENVINSYGYRVMGEGRVKEAIEVFRLNTVAFPQEYNTWDSLAESYMTNGQRDLAIKYYRKVLELRPGDENATRMLKRLEEGG